MQDDKLTKMLNEIVEEFNLPTHVKFRKLAQQSKRNQEKLKKSIIELQESLDYLRVCIKYTIFDLEATRRENRYLRRLLDELQWGMGN